ncbi:TadE/TadG family type IV pilus assembly protein [Nocardioides sp. SYSU D00038]|uniref:TadE/TadG family type IV pilus assembly protein n=1 Tax=Nocardioides sp. SYSU D00038 TaxID=2812554 RepID=UPI001967FF37|nr:TadE/TadG family type IV pilus assembly protein [Nocardioides sp. SYSU D00038]
MTPPRGRRRDRAGRGAAVVDFVLVLVVLVPVFLGILQVGLVLFVRNTLASAASEGARVAATADRGPADGEAVVRRQLAGVVSGRFARDVTVREASVGGAPGIVVTIRATVPALGLGGPGVSVEVSGHAVEEDP